MGRARTGAATSLVAIGIAVKVGATERVTVLAMRLSSVSGGSAGAAQVIYAIGYDLLMVRIHAIPHTAQMIGLKRGLRKLSAAKYTS